MKQNKFFLLGIITFLLVLSIYGCAGENKTDRPPSPTQIQQPSPTQMVEPTATLTATPSPEPTAIPTLTPTPIPVVLSEQFKEAVDAGIAWEELAVKAQEALTVSDAVTLMINAVKLVDESATLSYLQSFSSGKSLISKLNRAQLAELLWCTYVDITFGDGKYFHDTPHYLLERISASAIRYSVGEYYTRLDMPLDENEIYEVLEDGWRVVSYVISAYDRTNGEKLMGVYEDYTFRPTQSVTVEEAVGTFLRFSRSFEPKPVYTEVAEVGTHTIDKALYTGETSLPDATNRELPQWRGFNISFEGMLPPGCLSGNPDDNSYEAEITYMKELGANFAHVYLSWSWLQGPDYTCDSRVNLSRLEMLDEVIARCMENDIHLQLVFNDAPNFNCDADADLNDWFEYANSVFTDVTVRDATTAFWRMLARRYADIPNNYLSFNLMNECDPLDDENYAWAFKDALAAIWEESPGRVVVADVHSNNITGETMAALGCALSRHLYDPYDIATVNSRKEEDVPGFYENLKWPSLLTAGIIYGPDAAEYPKLAAQPITLTGNLSNARLQININDISWGYEVIRVKADDTVLYQGTPKTIYIAEKDRNMVTEHIDMAIPEGTKQVTISCLEGYAFSMNSFDLTYPDGTALSLNPQFDWWGGMEYVDVHIGEDYTLSGSVLGKEVNTYDFANVKAGLVSLNDLLAIGKKYNVDVMIGECGIFENGSNFTFGMSHETASGFIKDELELFESLGLAWACELYGRYTIMTPAPYLEGIEYRKIEGMPYYANLSMEKFFREMLDK